MIPLILAVEVLGMFGLSVAGLVTLMIADHIHLERRYKADVNRMSVQQANAHEPVAA